MQPDSLYSVTSYADPATAAFVVIPVLLMAVLMWGTAVAWKRSQRSPTGAALAVGAAFAAWMALTWGLAERGALRDWNATPPPVGLLVLAIVAISCAIAFSPLGRALTRHLPLWMLIAVQAFRLPLELAMHTMAERGVMPEQMTYTGFNFDILTGLTAIGVAAALRSGAGGRRLVWLWNIAGLALLINVVTIAILSTPTFAWFGPRSPECLGDVSALRLATGRHGHCRADRSSPDRSRSDGVTCHELSQERIVTCAGGEAEVRSPVTTSNAGTTSPRRVTASAPVTNHHQ